MILFIFYFIMNILNNAQIITLTYYNYEIMIIRLLIFRI